MDYLFLLALARLKFGPFQYPSGSVMQVNVASKCLLAVSVMRNGGYLGKWYFLKADNAMCMLILRWLRNYKNCH